MDTMVHFGNRKRIINELFKTQNPCCNNNIEVSEILGFSWEATRSNEDIRVTALKVVQSKLFPEYLKVLETSNLVENFKRVWFIEILVQLTTFCQLTSLNANFLCHSSKISPSLILTLNSSNTCIAFNFTILSKLTQVKTTLSRVVLFHNTRSKDSRPSNGRFMFAMNRLAVRTQPIFHHKIKRFHWAIQIGFDSFLLKLKSHKIKCSFSPPMHTSIGCHSKIVCREN